LRLARVAAQKRKRRKTRFVEIYFQKAASAFQKHIVNSKSVTPLFETKLHSRFARFAARCRGNFVTGKRMELSNARTIES